MSAFLRLSTGLGFGLDLSRSSSRSALAHSPLNLLFDTRLPQSSGELATVMASSMRAFSIGALESSGALEAAGRCSTSWVLPWETPAPRPAEPQGERRVIWSKRVGM